MPVLARILQEAVGVAETIRLASAQPVESNDPSIHSTLSIGVVAEPCKTIDALIARAHQATDRATQGGCNQVIPIEGSTNVVDLTGAPIPGHERSKAAG